MEIKFLLKSDSGWEVYEHFGGLNLSNAIPHHAFTYLKLLEFQDWFCNRVKRTRQKFQLPEDGLTLEELIAGFQYVETYREKHNTMPSELNMDSDLAGDYYEPIKSYLFAASQLILHWPYDGRTKHFYSPFPQFRIPDVVVRQIEWLLISDYLPLVNSKLTEGDFLNSSAIELSKSEYRTIIEIRSKVSKNQLLDFIENNFPKIEKSMDKRRSLPNTTISREDYQIYKLYMEHGSQAKVLEEIDSKRISSRNDYKRIDASIRRTKNKIKKLYG